MRNKENLYEALRICKETRKTDFYTNPEEYINPWENKDLKTAKLIDINFDNNTAKVQTSTTKITLPVLMSPAKLDTLYEIGNYYGITAFLDKNENMVDYSYITDDMLTPVRTIANGVIVYE